MTRPLFRLRRAAEINPDFAHAHHILGTVLSSLERLDAAEVSLRRALSIEPDSAAILLRPCDDSFGSQQGPGSSAADSEHARACADVDDQSIFSSCVARTKFMTDDSTNPRSTHNRFYRTVGNTVRALPAGTQSDHARRENRQVRTPRK